MCFRLVLVFANLVLSGGWCSLPRLPREGSLVSSPQRECEFLCDPTWTAPIQWGEQPKGQRSTVFREVETKNCNNKNSKLGNARYSYQSQRKETMPDRRETLIFPTGGGGSHESEISSLEQQLPGEPREWKPSQEIRESGNKLDTEE